MLLNLTGIWKFCVPNCPTSRITAQTKIKPYWDVRGPYVIWPVASPGPHASPHPTVSTLSTRLFPHSVTNVMFCPRAFALIILSEICLLYSLGSLHKPPSWVHLLWPLQIHFLASTSHHSISPHPVLLCFLALHYVQSIGPPSLRSSSFHLCLPFQGGSLPGTQSTFLPFFSFFFFLLFIEWMTPAFPIVISVTMSLHLVISSMRGGAITKYISGDIHGIKLYYFKSRSPKLS